jgi:hypothetical protein
MHASDQFQCLFACRFCVATTQNMHLSIIGVWLLKPVFCQVSMMGGRLLAVAASDCTTTLLIDLVPIVVLSTLHALIFSLVT